MDELIKSLSYMNIYYLAFHKTLFAIFGCFCILVGFFCVDYNYWLHASCHLLRLIFTNIFYKYTNQKNTNDILQSRSIHPVSSLDLAKSYTGQTEWDLNTGYYRFIQHIEHKHALLLWDTGKDRRLQTNHIYIYIYACL